MIQHLACIMDGNRRWARKKGWRAWYGHKQGVQAAKRTIEFCIEENIPYLSLYTFSLENFKRPKEELNYLFETIFKGMFDEFYQMCVKHKVRVRFIGERSLFPKDLEPMCTKLEQQTEQFNRLTVNFLFCYGSQQEMVSGVKRIIKKVKAGLLSENDISNETIEQHLWTNGTPPPDIVLRTGGLKRLSNFLLYQAAYSEFYFLDCMWPEITKTHLQGAMSYFSQCQRNFGT